MNRRRYFGLSHVLIVTFTLPVATLAKSDAARSAQVVSAAATKAARVHVYQLSQRDERDEIDIAVIQEVQKLYFSGGDVQKLHLRGSEKSPSEVPCFIEIDGKDPSASLLRRISARIGPCQKLSACKQTQQGLFDAHGVFDRATGKAGVIFGVSAPQWVSDHEVIVDGYHTQARQRGAGAKYQVIKKKNHWQTIQPREFWVA